MSSRINTNRFFRNLHINYGSVVDRMNYSLTVTQDCNLACKYCYECKNSNSKMDFETAKKAVDFALGYNTHLHTARIAFMGGEPFLEISLIDKIVDYIKFRLYEERHPWFGKMSFDITTNGVLYHTEEVQTFIKKNLNLLNISMTVDGIEAKHDMNRVFKNGEGSFSRVVKNVPLWLSQFPLAGTKVTFASQDLKYLMESLVFINSLGIKSIVATIVNEDVWSDGDEIIYENQLRKLADYMITHNCPVEFSGDFFAERIGLPYDKDRLKLNWCNCGENNFEIDYKGNLYPCVRFIPFTLEKEARVVGNVITGVDTNKLRPFECLTFINQSSQECLACPVANDCSWCAGNNYNNSPHDSILGREIAICKMHKARVRANDYYWARVKNTTGRTRRVLNIDRKRFLYIMLSDNSVNYCCESKGSLYSNHTLSLNEFTGALRFARVNAMTPVVVRDNQELSKDFIEILQEYEYIQIIPPSLTISDSKTDCITVLSSTDVFNYDCTGFLQVILHIRKNEIKILPELCSRLFNQVLKIVLIVDDWNTMLDDDLDQYHHALVEISDIIIERALLKKYSQINVLTDLLITKAHMNCGAGFSSMLLAPNGKLYPCSSFYHNGYENIGNIYNGVTADLSVYSMAEAPICKYCDINSCKFCVYDNIHKTKEYKVPSIEQCAIKNVEKLVSINLQHRLVEIDPKTPFAANPLQKTDYPEALELIVSEKYDQYK